MATSSTSTTDPAGEPASTTSRRSTSTTRASRTSTKISITSTTSSSTRRSTSTQSRSLSITSTSSRTYTTSTASITSATSISITSSSSTASTANSSPDASNFGPVNQVNVGAIVGGVVAVVIVLAALTTLYCWWHARRSRNERQDDFARTSVLRNSNSLDHDMERAQPSSMPKTAKVSEYQLAQTLPQTQTLQNPRFSYTPISHETSFAHSYYAPTASPPPPSRSPAMSPPLPSSTQSPPALPFQSYHPSPPSTYQPLPPPTTSHKRDSIPDFNSTLYTHDKDELDTDILPRIHPAFRPHSYSLSALTTHASGGSKPRRASHSGHIYAPLSQEETPRIYGLPIPEIEIMDAELDTYRKEP
ncbi:hypothetical protein MBLNU457_g0815t1 [Dothideomycetes sp. NU457]